MNTFGMIARGSPRRNTCNGAASAWNVFGSRNPSSCASVVAPLVTPNVGDHSIAAPLNIGLTDASLRTPDMPLYTLECNATGQIVKTMDPGRALITGRCADIGKTKGPILRGLAARAPYFHNGSAATLMDVVEFYNTRFNLELATQEKADLVAFLKTL